MSATVACADLAPQGILRASINLGNPLLARRDGNSGEVFGVSIDLARALAERWRSSDHRPSAIIGQAPQVLKAGGWLLFEHGWDQATDVAQLMQAAGFVQVQHRQDLADTDRCTGGQWPGRA